MPASESVADLSNREGTPAWKCPSAAVLIFNLGVGWGIWGEEREVVVSSLLPHPNLVPHSEWHCSLILPFGDIGLMIGLMIQHQAEGRGKERLGPVGSRCEWVGGAHASGEEQAQ